MKRAVEEILWSDHDEEDNKKSRGSEDASHSEEIEDDKLAVKACDWGYAKRQMKLVNKTLTSIDSLVELRRSMTKYGLEKHFMDIIHLQIQKTQKTMKEVMHQFYRTHEYLQSATQEVVDNEQMRKKLLDTIKAYGAQGLGRKQWVLDQVVRNLCGDDEDVYNAWVNDHDTMVIEDEGEELFSDWTTGIPPSL